MKQVDRNEEKWWEMTFWRPAQPRDYSYHRVQFRDMDGDGDLDAITARFHNTNQEQNFLWMENPGQPVGGAASFLFFLSRVTFRHHNIFVVFDYLWFVSVPDNSPFPKRMMGFNVLSFDECRAFALIKESFIDVWWAYFSTYRQQQLPIEFLVDFLVARWWEMTRWTGSCFLSGWTQHIMVQGGPDVHFVNVKLNSSGVPYDCYFGSELWQQRLSLHCVLESIPYAWTDPSNVSRFASSFLNANFAQIGIRITSQ